MADSNEAISLTKATFWTSNIAKNSVVEAISAPAESIKAYILFNSD